MVYLIVDDEQFILEGMEDTLRGLIDPEDEIYSAIDPFQAIEQLKLHNVDIMFTDVDMPGMNGLKLAEKAHDVRPDLDIIFCTGYAHYSLDAWKTVAKAFILKPVNGEEMAAALKKVKDYRKLVADAKNSGGVATTSKKALVAQCFGNFELFFEGAPVHFSRKKSKEMVAYLIDRKGAMITTGDIRSALWDEDADSEEKKGYIRVLANDIRKSLEDIGISDFLRNDMDCYSVNTHIISCDYLDYLNGDEKAKASYNGEYMLQYSWGENTLATLE